MFIIEFVRKSMKSAFILVIFGIFTHNGIIQVPPISKLPMPELHSRHHSSIQLLYNIKKESTWKSHTIKTV